MKNKCLLVLVLAFCAIAPAFGASSKLIGTTLLTRQENDVDVLRFASCRSGVAQLKLQVRRADAEIEAIVVHFANGESTRLNVRQRFNQGGESRWVDLPGGNRCISKIKLVGDSEGSKKQAKVAIFGR